MDATKVTTGKPKATGAVFCSLGASVTAPTSTSAAVTSFTDMGYCGEDGLKNDPSASVSNIKAWGGAIVLSSVSEKKDEFKIKLIEARNPNVLKAVHGKDNVTTATSEITVKAGSTLIEKNVWVFDMISTGNKAHRIVIPSGAVVSVAEISYNDTDAVGFELTIAAYPDSTGFTHYEYIAT